MNKPCARITLDLQQASTPTFVAVKKSDIGREIRITLSDGGFSYEISADCYAVLTGTKPDGNILYNHCDIEGNTIVYEITEQTTAAAGRMKAEVKLYGADDQFVTSATFRIIIDGTVYDEGKVESKDEVSALTHLVSEAASVINNGNQMIEQGQQTIQSAETAMQQATNAAEQAGNSAADADAAAGAATQASNDANTAAGKANTAAQNADTAASKANTAAANVRDAAVSATNAAGSATSAAGNANDAASRANAAAASASAAASEAVSAAKRAEEAADSINSSGGNADYVGVEPAEEDIPKVFISGVKPTTKDDVLAEMEYISKTDRFHAYLEIKCQGSSSMDYPKKNYTVKMYSDETRETKQKKVFKNWNHESNKFVLKANWIDHSHARNIVSARIWDEVVKSRVDYTTLPEEMRNSPRNGAIDGFPVKLYYNGTYEGLYTWNIGKDAWMWDMDEDNANHVLLCAEVNNNGEEVDTAANFRTLWEGSNEYDWAVEVGEKNSAVVSSLNTLISCVKDTDDETFKSTVGNYLDIQSAIDYWIHQYIICGLDGLGKNLLMATYDGQKWICGAYDMDSTFGLHLGGGYFVSAQFRCPEDYQENRSLLWERISTLFAEETKSRYLELRKTVYSYANLVTHFERFMDVIGLDLYAEDLTVYTEIPSISTNNIQQIRNFIRDRLAYCDLKLNPPDGALYPFNNGSYEWTVGDAESPNILLNVTNGNHVEATGKGVLNTGIFVNISNPEVNTENIETHFNFRQGETKFTLKTGDEVKIVLNAEKGISTSAPVCLYLGNPTTGMDLLKDAPGSVTETFVMTEDMAVSNIGFYCYFWSDNADRVSTVSFNIELYVNDVQYI